MTVEMFPLGSLFHAEHEDNNATVAMRLGIVDDDLNDITIGSDERLACVHAMYQTPAANVEGALFFDNDNTADALTPITFVDGVAGEDTVSFSGDRADEFRAGRPFTIANDSDNDGSYTSTGASYDSGTGLTTVNVATASWSGVTSDGDLTSVFFQDTNAGTTGALALIDYDTHSIGSAVIASWPVQAMRKGPPGYTLYVQAAAAAQTNVIVDGFVQKVLTKTLPISGPQAR